MDIFFTDYFDILEDTLEEYGAFNLSLVTDLPLFVDPFLLFDSENVDYQKLHHEMIAYLIFLREKSQSGNLNKGLIDSWYRFKEVKENWLGFCLSGNTGRGLGKTFANALNSSLANLFHDFGEEQITSGTHIEKLCLISHGVGRDTISDFTTNLIKEFLLKYTEDFTLEHISKDKRKAFSVPKVRFDYKRERWRPKTYTLPLFDGHYVILTPQDMLTKDENWINKGDIIRNFNEIPNAIPDSQLRAQISNYFSSVLPRRPNKKERNEAISKTVVRFPSLVDYYIKYKEDNGDIAKDRSIDHVLFSKRLYIEQFRALVDLLNEETEFYRHIANSEQDTRSRIEFLKDVIENKGGHRIFYIKGEPIKKEEDLQIMYRLTWFATDKDVTREANDGRGPVDFKISKGAQDKVLVEMKLASNSQIKRNLEKQVEVYEKASDTKCSFKVILYFSFQELRKVERILKELKLEGDQNIYLIDARSDNKPSGSKA